MNIRLDRILIASFRIIPIPHWRAINKNKDKQWRTFQIPEIVKYKINHNVRIKCNIKHQKWFIHTYSIIVASLKFLRQKYLLSSFHFYYKLRILLKRHISPLFRYEIRNKEDAKMTDFPRLFFWRKLSTVTWKQTICLSRLATTDNCMSSSCIALSYSRPICET